jgi:hypothetical protein
MNSNLFHNIANVATALIALITAVLMAIGCTVNAVTGALDCSSLNPKFAVYATSAITIIQLLKMGVNVVRDGFSGLTKPQPPVQK